MNIRTSQRMKVRSSIKPPQNKASRHQTSTLEPTGCELKSKKASHRSNSDKDSSVHSISYYFFDTSSASNTNSKLGSKKTQTKAQALVQIYFQTWIRRQTQALVRRAIHKVETNFRLWLWLQLSNNLASFLMMIIPVILITLDFKEVAEYVIESD